MYEKTFGRYYTLTRDLDIAEIAKRVRADLKRYQADGLLPAKAKFTVRIDRFSGGQSLDVTLTGMPDTWTYVSPGLEPDYANYVPAHGGYTADAQDALATMKKIMDAYNYDGSDVQTDYFDVRFYGHAEIQNERWQRFADEEKARKAARRAARGVSAAVPSRTAGDAARLH